MTAIRSEFLILDEVFALADLEGVCNAAQVHTPAVPAHLAADAASAELIWNRGLRQQSEFDAAALAASVKFPVDVCQ